MRPVLAIPVLLALSTPLAGQIPVHTKAQPLKVIDVRWIDTTANACTDSFQYANGAWLQQDTIPAAYSSSGVARDMSDQNELVVRQVLDTAAARRSRLPFGRPGTAAQR